MITFMIIEMIVMGDVDDGEGNDDYDDGHEGLRES